MHRTIVVSAPEGRPLQDALTLAVGLARPRGAQVVVLRSAAVADEPLPDIGAHDVPVAAVAGPVRHGRHALHEAVAELGAELLVLDPVTAADSTHEAPCAIAVAPEGSDVVAPHEPRHVTVGWDGTPEADEALEYAIQLAERTAGSVRVVHVVEHGGVGRPDLRARLDDVRGMVSERVPCTTELRAGAPVKVLTADFADADLLVLGSRGRGALLQVVLGSVAAGVMTHATCPVLVVPRGVHAPVETVA